MVTAALKTGTSRRPQVSDRLPSSLSHGGGSSEVGEEFEAEAHHKVPDVSGHLGSGDEDAPNEHHQDGVEGVADVPQPEQTNMVQQDADSYLPTALSWNRNPH